MTVSTSQHPAVVSGRLAAYLVPVLAANGTITSGEIGHAVGVNSTQVRRDLSQLLGRTGRRGVGYDTTKLASEIRQTLGSAAGGSGGVVLIAAARARLSDVPPEILAWIRDAVADDVDDTVAELARLGAAIAAEIDHLTTNGGAHK